MNYLVIMETVVVLNTVYVSPQQIVLLKWPNFYAIDWQEINLQIFYIWFVSLFSFLMRDFMSNF